ncbi:hypothetical protein ACFX2C_010034 [Malus domestica]|nr:uncharacterized protein LOC114820184 [Malus domestica]
MFSGNPDPPKKSLITKQADENKFFSKHLSKESSVTNPSLRVYYGGLPANVPFVWESQPGTPNYAFSEDTVLPPLTPPPSYYSNSYKKPTNNKHSRSNLLHTLFLKISLKKTQVPSSPSSSPSSLFSPSSNSSVSTRKYHGRNRFTSNSSFDSMGDYEEEDVGSPTSTLCFRLSRVSTGGNRGCHGF